MSKIGKSARRIARRPSSVSFCTRPSFGGPLGAKRENRVIRGAERKLGYKLMKKKDCGTGSAGKIEKIETATEKRKRLQTLKRKGNIKRKRTRRKKGTDRRIDSMPRPPLKRHFQRRGRINVHERVIEDHEKTTHIDKNVANKLRDDNLVRNYHAPVETVTKNINISPEQNKKMIAAARRRSRGHR